MRMSTPASRRPPPLVALATCPDCHSLGGLDPSPRCLTCGGDGEVLLQSCPVCYAEVSTCRCSEADFDRYLANLEDNAAMPDWLTEEEEP
jgi:predicted amidophosphoribosyltransferase